MSARQPSAPRATEAILAATALVTACATLLFELMRSDAEVDASFAAGFLWLFSALFLLRVVGQLVARELEPAWLPPTQAWNLTPYRLLLPVQLGILALMAWIDIDLSREAGCWANPKPRFGDALRWFAYAYAAVMAVRYVVRMRRNPDQRWFGGAIPIVFHWVLAAYLYVLGSFYASY